MTDDDGRRVAKDFIARHRLEFIRVVFADIHGILRSKLLPAAEYLRRLANGVRFSEAVFARDATGQRVDATGLTFETGAPDYVARPDPGTYCPMPWQPGMGQVMADLYTPDNTPAPCAPRSVLRRICELMITCGYLPRVASELEFYVVAGSTCRPINPNTQPYCALDLTRPDAFLDDIVSVLARMRIPVEAIHREAGPGQFEISLKPQTALRTADQTVLLKNAIKELARKRNAAATFMAKPFSDQAGSGFHLHQSLWDRADQVNLFAPQDGSALSTTALRFITGQLAHLPAAMVFFAPTVNSYKRLQPDSFTPVNCTWGFDNRTAALRVPRERGAGCRVEHRVAGADANPYLTIAAALGTGYFGLQGDTPLVEQVTGDACKAEGAHRLPRSLAEALDAIAGDEDLAGLMGRALVELLVTVKRAESTRYERHVTEWERQAYLEVL